MSASLLSRKVPSLSFFTIGFVLISAIFGMFIGFYVLDKRAHTFQEKVLASAVQTRVEGVQVALGQAMYREWNGLKAAAHKLSSTPRSQMQGQLDLLAGNGNIVSWAGYARDDGTVEAASNGLLQNVNVASRPWFQRGLEGPFAGNVHDAVLLASNLHSTDGAPLRFLDLAMPVSASDGTPEGVVGLHLNFVWARDLVGEMAKSLNIDIFIVDSSGRAIIATDGRTYANPDLASFRSARAGASGVFVETWPNGRSYFTATLPELKYHDLPRFGWTIIARIPAETYLAPAHEFSNELVFNLMLFGVFLILLTLLFITAYVRPFQRLAHNAKAIADGAEVYPYESSRTWELATIGAALSRLQSDVATHEHRERERNLSSVGSTPHDERFSERRRAGMRR